MERPGFLATFLDKLEGRLFLLFFFWLPFGTRITLHGFGERFFPYNTVFFYATDLIAAMLVAACLLRTFRGETSAVKRVIRFFRYPVFAALLVFLGVALVSSILRPSGGLAVAAWIRLWLFAMLAICIAGRLRGLGTLWLWAVFASGAAQALIGVLQFFRQKDLGLSILGENALSPVLAGVAKLDVAGEKIVRAYGTLPHPNALAAFLLFALVLSAYFYVRRDKQLESSGSAFAKKYFDGIWLGGVVLMELGLVFSFSRSGLLAFAIAVVVWLFCFFANRGQIERRQWHRAGALLLVTIFVAVFSSVVFGEELRARASVSADEQAFSLRAFLTRASVYEINDHRLFGVGPGGFVPALARYVSPALPEWTYQPVHNLYLLAASEAGLLGLMAFLFFIGFSLRLGIRRAPSFHGTATFAIFSAFLLLGFFDHYFWTFEQGIALWWVAVGLLLASRHAGDASMDDMPFG